MVRVDIKRFNWVSNLDIKPRFYLNNSFVDNYLSNQIKFLFEKKVRILMFTDINIFIKCI